MMNDKQLKAVVLDFVHEVCGVPPSQIVPTRHFLDYGVDSVSAVDFMVMLEDRFSIDIPDHVFARMKCVDDVVRYLYGRFESDSLPYPESAAQ
jgi:acyl carrier protein